MFKKGIIIVGTVVLTLATGCEKETPPPQTTVTVSPVISGNISSSLQLIGQVKALDKVDLVARVKGFLIKQNFNEGELVKKGSVLFEIEPDRYLAKLKAAEANYQKALADQKNADSDYKRQESLYKGDAVSERARDNALAKKMECDAQVKACEAAIDDAKLELSYTKIIAPFDGRVGLRSYSVGNVVGPESGVLLSIAKINPINISFSFSEKTLLTLSENSSPDDSIVKILLPNGMEYAITGKIVKWDNRVNPGTGTIKFEAEFKNPQQILIDGMYVNVIIEPKQPIRGLLIPRQAVQEIQDEKFVMVVSPDNIVSRQTVELGRNDEIFVAVNNGLKEGDIIIIEGLQKIRPQSKVVSKIDERYSSQAAAEVFYRLKRPQKFGANAPASSVSEVSSDTEAAK
ncbi:MAG: efflux RND transporter periplasmic adaptor subunit [Victivallaceae bacterium]|nr:efflux RND transporter periplasmic adaptor subunit [Victivallaceae bacterium]